MRPACQHWRDCGITGGGCCTIGAYEGPSLGTCLLACKQYEGTDRAPQIEQLKRSWQDARVGDVLSAQIAAATGKLPCVACNGIRTLVNGIDKAVRG